MTIPDAINTLKRTQDANRVRGDDLGPPKTPSIDVFHQKYEVKEELGRGLTSVVYKCVDRYTSQQNAVKIIDLYHNSDFNILDSILCEVNALAVLPPHPSIIALHEVYQSETNVYIVLELAPNGELFDYVNKHVKLPEKTTCMLMEQLFQGIEHLHSHNVVHRDIKMENILLNDKFGIKLTDFGFAKLLNDGERLYDLCGTLSYLAPELIRASMGVNKAGYGVEVDMWACGVLLYTLITGHPPFSHHKQLQLMRQIQDAKYNKNCEAWKQLSPSVQTLIGSLLQPNPSERLTAKQALQHPWFNNKRSFSHNKKKHKTFKNAAILVFFISSLKISAAKAADRCHVIDQTKLSVKPYQIKTVRKALDDVAFTIYGHWVQREDPASRALMFQHKRVKDKTRTVSTSFDDS